MRRHAAASCAPWQVPEPWCAEVRECSNLSDAVSGMIPLEFGVVVADTLAIARTLVEEARTGEQLAGVMKFELEDPFFWPEIAPGTSAFVHKLAVRRAWAKKGVSTDLLSFARYELQTTQ